MVERSSGAGHRRDPDVAIGMASTERRRRWKTKAIASTAADSLEIAGACGPWLGAPAAASAGRAGARFGVLLAAARRGMKIVT
jgi:hypothetical protein